MELCNLAPLPSLSTLENATTSLIAATRSVLVSVVNEDLDPTFPNTSLIAATRFALEVVERLSKSPILIFDCASVDLEIQ